MRRCNTCQKEKDFSEFNKKLGGLQPTCRSCCSAKNKERYEKGKEKILKQCADYRKEHRKENIEYAREYRKTEAGKKVAIKNTYKQMAKNPHKFAARKAVRNAVRRGELEKLNCEVCGSDKDVHGHHESYTKKDWLKVVWLCREHHVEWHNLDEIYAS